MREKSIFLKISNYQLVLISLFPLGLVIGPLIGEIIINLFNIIFIINFRKKNYSIVNKKLYLFLLIFNIYLIFNCLISGFEFENFLKTIFYFRFPLFALAVYFYLKENLNHLKYIFFSLIFTIIIIVVDSYIQYFSDENILGFPKYRPDRISSFFNDDLILGSFLFRIMPVFIWFIYLFKDIKKINYISSALFIFLFITIFMSGERASFILASFYIILLLLLINLKLKFKINLIIILSLITSIYVYKDPIIKDRYVKQLKTHIISKSHKYILPQYTPMFITSIKMFKNSIFFGEGFRSYRVKCRDKRFETFYQHNVAIDNHVINTNIPWKIKDTLEITKFFVNEGDVIKNGQILFEYKYSKSNKIFQFISKKNAKIDRINIKEKYYNNSVVFDVTPLNTELPKIEYIKKNSCNTHPHNYYFQLLAETGLIGFCFVFGLFIYLSKIIFVYFRNMLFNNFVNNNLEKILILSFFVSLWPFITTGNFFNNWINMLNFYPLAFYLLTKDKYFKQNESKIR